MQGGEFGLYAEMDEQGGAVARILGGDDVHGLEDFQRAQRNVLQVSNRRGDHI